VELLPEVFVLFVALVAVAHTVVPGMVKIIAATRPTATIFVVSEVSDLFVCLFVCLFSKMHPLTIPSRGIEPSCAHSHVKGYFLCVVQPMCLSGNIFVPYYP